MRGFDILTQVLLIVGGLNWLLVGLFQFDLVAALFGGQDSALARIVYVVVGICAIWQAIRLPATAMVTTTAASPSVPPRRPGDPL